MLSRALEDHLGDVVRKARLAARVELAAVARAAGLTDEKWENFEESGQGAAQLKLPAVASLLGLEAQKLVARAGGWLPEPVELRAWRELRVITTTRGGNTVNCYLAWDEVTREAALFDTGWEAPPLLTLLEENALELKHLFLTHLHEDHVAAMGALREKYPKLHLHTYSKTVPVQHRNRANDFIQLGSLRITNRETPGHAEEGAIYIIGTWPDDAPHVAIVGDTLFAGSMASGMQSWELLKDRIRSQIFSLPDETLLCPGHGPLTTVAQERRSNPFF